MRTMPHVVGHSVYTPVLTARRSSALQRTRLSPVLNRVDQSDGPDGRPGGRVPPPLRWVDFQQVMVVGF